jgi:hypothetical protein
MTFSRMNDGLVLSFDRDELAQVKTMMFKTHSFGSRVDNETIEKIGDYFTSLHSNNNLKKIFAMRNLQGSSNTHIKNATENLFVVPEYCEVYDATCKETYNLVRHSYIRLSQVIDFIVKDKKFVVDYNELVKGENCD